MHNVLERSPTCEVSVGSYVFFLFVFIFRGVFYSREKSVGEFEPNFVEMTYKVIVLLKLPSFPQYHGLHSDICSRSVYAVENLTKKQIRGAVH